ncbi:MAG: GFA family protein [Myxococcaceae bacterium]
MTKKAKTLKGGCECGGVEFRLSPPLRPVVWCHCSKCQRFHGGPGAYTTAPRAALRFTRRTGLKWWNASKTVQRGFCGKCGASLFFSDSDSDTVSIAAGALTSPTGLKSSLHIFVGSKPDWYQLHDDLPRRREY